jgi:hypothetical protein
MHDVNPELIVQQIADGGQLDPRLSRKVEGAAMVPAHVEIYNSLPEEMKALWYVHYMWSNVSCIRVRPKMLGAASKYLANGEFVSGFELESRFRAAIESAITGTPHEVSFDTLRDHKGYAGFFCYLGVKNSSAIKPKAKAEVREEMPPKTVLSNAALKAQMVASLANIQEELPK